MLGNHPNGLLILVVTLSRLGTLYCYQKWSKMPSQATFGWYKYLNRCNEQYPRYYCEIASLKWIKEGEKEKRKERKKEKGKERKKEKRKDIKKGGKKKGKKERKKETRIYLGFQQLNCFKTDTMQRTAGSLANTMLSDTEGHGCWPAPRQCSTSK